MRQTNTASDSAATEHNQETGYAPWPFLVALIPLFATFGSANAAQREPFIPANANVVLQHVPPTTDPRVREFDALRSQLKQHPDDTKTAVALARAYITYGRSTGDARFLGRALAVIQPWMQQSTPPIPVLLVHATIQQSRHSFQAARAELAHILELDPGNAQAWLNLATIAMVQGDMDRANDACVGLGSHGSSFLGLACSASLRALTGRADQAYALLSFLLQQQGAAAPASTQAWILGLMADTASRMGDTAMAEKHFKRALQLLPGDNFLLSAYADFLLDQDRPRDLIALLGDYTESDTAFLRLVMAETALGLPEAGADANELAARFAAMGRRGSHVYQREHAMFALHVQHDPERALQLAIENWKVQRAPKDVEIYLQAALAADAPAAAAPVMDFVAQTQLGGVHIEALLRRIRMTQLGADQLGADQLGADQLGEPQQSTATATSPSDAR